MLVWRQVWLKIGTLEAIHHVFVSQSWKMWRPFYQNVGCHQSESAMRRKKDMVKGRESILLPDASIGGKSVWKLLVPKAWLFWPPQTTLFVSRNVRVDKSVIWYALCRDWKYINLYVFIYLFIIIIIIISALFNYHVKKRQITRKRK